MPPRFLYFDLGKVLLDFSHEQMCRQMAEVAGVSTEEVWQAVFGDANSRAALVEYESGRISTNDFFAQFCRATGTSPNRGRLTDAVCNIFSPIEPMGDLVRQLAAAGNQLGILSNTNPVQWESLSDGRFPLVALGQSTCPFNWAILSYEVGVMKPDRAIYAAAIERAGVAPHQVFFTDDRLDNVAGALAAGIDAVQFVDCDRLIADLQDRGVAGV